MRAYVYQFLTMVMIGLTCSIVVFAQLILPRKLASLEEVSASETPHAVKIGTDDLDERLNSLTNSPSPEPAILQRPVFIATRRPFVAQDPPQVVSTPAPTVAVIAPEAPSATYLDPSILVLKGTFFDGRNSAALILNPNNQSTIWYEIGSDLEGWEISEIAANDVMLSHAGQSVRIKQYVDNSQPALAGGNQQQ